MEKLDTRPRILRAAAAIFREKGFNGASMQELAAAVGLTKSTLYHHFPSKQALLREILESTVERATPRLQAIARADLPASERLRQAVVGHVVELIRDRDNVACFVAEGRFLAPAYMEAHVAKRDRYERYLRQIIEDGIETGEFSPTDVRVASRAILGMCNSVASWYRPEGELGAEKIAAHYGEWAVRALAAPTGTGA